MSFLQQPLLWGLLAAAIPIVVHLLNRRRHRTVKWAAMEFLLKATRESRGKKKLKHLIILACRALAVAALIFAISRPLIGGFFGWGSQRVDNIVLILDRSASMELQAYSAAKGSSKGSGNTSKRASVIESIRSSLKELGNPRLTLIDSASGKPQNVPSPDALAEISATSATDTRSSIPSLISTAIDYITANSSGSTEIWVASDLQETDWEPDQGSWESIRTGLNELPQKTTLRVLSITSPPTDNVAIRVHSSRRNGTELVLDLEITRPDENYSNASIPITFSINGTLSSDNIKISGQSYQFQKRLPIGKATAKGHGFVSIPSDTNPRDNVSFFAYGEDAPTKTYLITEGGESSRWLTLAAAPPGFGNSQCILLGAESAHKIDWLNTALIIWQAELPDPVIAQEFSRYIQSGGAALILPPRADSEATYLGMQWGELTESARDQFLIVDDWNQSEGPLKNGADGTRIPVSKLKAIKRRQIIGEATTLASWEDAAPFLVRRVIGDGTAIFAASLPDYSWSNLADADVLLPLIQRMISSGDARFGSAFSAITGSINSQNTSDETLTRIDSYAESTSSNAPYESGVWQLGDHTLASNRPVSEDQWKIVSNSQLDTLLEGTSYKLFEDKGQSDALAQEIWRAFLIAMLVFLITEAILCLQPKALSQKS
ncbi:BatA domain-containing protein [Akkermansiaceae bacterium]|nr:BatA domain-containing protein [Akkermansiaceae bacterium]